MWKSAYVGVYQLLNWKMHGETLKIYQYYAYNLDLLHREQAVGTLERPVGESSVEKKTNVYLLWGCYCAHKCNVW